MSKEWVKSWTCSLNKPKIMSLPADEFKCWQILQWIAGEHDDDGRLPPVDECAFIMHIAPARVAEMIHALAKRRLIDQDDNGWRMHDWQVWQKVEEWNTREAWRDRKRRQREKERMSQNVTRDVVTERDMSQVTLKNRIDKTRSDETRSEREKENIHPATQSVSSLAPQRENQTAQQAMIAALMLANGSDPTQKLTKAEGARYGKAASEIIAANGDASEVAERARNYATRFPDAPCTPSALAAHWGECATASPVKKNGHYATKGEAIEQRTMQGIEDFRRLRGSEQSDESSNVRAGDDRAGNRLQSGRERPASERLLRPTKTSQ